MDAKEYSELNYNQKCGLAQKINDASFIVMVYNELKDDKNLVCHIALNDLAPKEVLAEITKKAIVNSDITVLVYIAQNINCSLETFEELSKLHDTRIDERLCKNKSLPKEICFELYKLYQVNEDMLYELASNNSCVPEILDEMSKKNSEDLNRYISDNKNSPSKTLEYILNLYPSSSKFKLNLCGNPNTPIKILKNLIKESLSLKDFDNYENLLINDSVPSHIKHKMIGEEKFIRYFNSRNGVKNITATLKQISDYSVRANLAKKIIEARKEKTYSNEKSENISTPTIRSGEKLYEAFLKRQELQYKYDKLKEQYNHSTGSASELKYPPYVNPKENDSLLPILKFNLGQINKTIIGYLSSVITRWRKERIQDRHNRIEEMKRNEAIIADLAIAKKSKDLQFQSIAIEKALNTIHSHGDMIEHLDIGLHNLDYLSNMDTTRWDKELEHMASKSISFKKISSRDTTIISNRE